MIAGPAVFYALAVAMVLSALGMVLARNVVHAALLMVAHFLMTAVIYVLLRAPFIAVVQVAVYAGAIMVLFLFVVMLLGDRSASFDEHLTGQRPLGIALVALLAGLLVYVVRDGVPAASSAAAGAAGAAGDAGALVLPADFGSPGAIADLLFREYVLPLEMVSALLLVAMLGAVVVARVRRPDRSDVVAEADSDGVAGPAAVTSVADDSEASDGSAGDSVEGST